MHRRVIGIDLAGVEHRPTGFCLLRNSSIRTKIIYTDDEIVSEIKKVRPVVIAIDAPLSLPDGRKTLNRKSRIHFRKCDTELRNMGIKFFPITLGPMRKLTERGIKLKKKLQTCGFKVIEVYPGGAQEMLGIPRKQAGLDELRNGLRKLGIKGIRYNMTGDELDAITCAVVGNMWANGKALEIGDPKEGLMIMPVRN